MSAMKCLMWCQRGCWWACLVVAAVLALDVKETASMRSLMRGSQYARDLSVGSKALQGLQAMWNKESQEEQQGVLIDPKKTWTDFLENSERQRRTRRRKNRKRGRRLPYPRTGPPGPAGPRGPSGPPGKDGGTLTTDEMEEYILDFLREYFSDRNNNNTVNVTGEEDERSLHLSRRSRVSVAFTAVLPRPATLNSAALSILDSFTITFSPGVFERRVVLEHGGFTVTKGGLYQVSASLLLHPKGRTNSLFRSNDEIRAYVCVDNCQKDSRRLEWSGTLSEGSQTAILTGHVLLIRGHTLLLAVDNPSRRQIQVSTGSSFSAALIGT